MLALPRAQAVASRTLPRVASCIPPGHPPSGRRRCPRPEPPSAWIRLVGGVDLTAVTYVGSTFLAFVAALRDTHPESELVLHNPSVLARIVLAATGMDRHVAMGDDPASPVASSGPDDPAVTIV